ncbi:NUDIX hydrolase [Penicillium cf. griseofulvum]|uniref:NUDIX hydrolase n=1 Tax=Penicillium cf. griseofulvum TaxID=2972120 RepID=A0A9W9J4P4_9EURO|nr:NUDIX hydrolase [Penicillium cf. griseofulvum]KAJ5427804.1 NUDIX hydrolase [Penicillium cf. griseofulvum]KAJ5432006.1 NUDIX hydrolase [Penicillium cf. griseofulvum]
MDPKVGLGVFVFNDAGKFVIGKRKGSLGAGTWGLPGGHLEFGESFETCATRETLEETGLKIKDVRFLNATNSIMTAENKHYITIFMSGVCEGNVDPQILEPEKCEGWEWISWDELRAYGEEQMKADVGFEGRRLFLPLLELFRQRPDFRV